METIKFSSQEESFQPRLVNTMSLPDFDLYQFFDLASVLLWTIHHHSHKYLSNLSSTSEQNCQANYYNFTKAKHKNQNIAALNCGSLQETRTQDIDLYVIGQKFASEWVTHLHILPHNNSRFYAFPYPRLKRKKISPQCVHVGLTSPLACNMYM